MARARNSRKPQPEAAQGFWDKPVLMDLASDLLIVMGVLALVWAAALAVQRLPFFPLRQLIVVTPLEQVNRGQIEHTAQTVLSGNFFTVNIDAARQVFEKLPWVRQAAMRRRWPDGVELSLEEHVAAARWQRGEDEPLLVDTKGDVFAANYAGAERLPALSGPEGSAPDVLEHYRQIAQTLAPLGRRPTALVLTPRQAWELKLDDGVVVELGRDDAKHVLADRIARFAAYYPAALKKIGGMAAVADMRYPNGFALRLARRS